MRKEEGRESNQGGKQGPPGRVILNKGEKVRNRDGASVGGGRGKKEGGDLKSKGFLTWKGNDSNH